MWDFETALSDTIKEKYESLYVKVIEVDGKPWNYKGNNMKNYWLKDKEGVSMNTCREVAARVWCDKEFSHVTMDTKICEKIALLLFEAANHYELDKNDEEYFKSKLFNELNISEEYYHG
jgi:hypothetical protein